MSTIDENVRAFLSESKNADKTFTSTELAFSLVPEQERHGGAGILALNRFYRTLLPHAKTTLADCCTRDTKPKKVMGRISYGWIWHAPRVKLITCPLCGGQYEEGPRR